MQLQENLIVADRFRLVRMIGRGGMGSVWQAIHVSLDQPCAVKFIEGELANVAEAHARFEREAKAAAQLRSPHVVQILDHGVWQGRPYIAMELLDGEDLGKALGQAGGKLPPAQVNAVIQQVCRALTKAHAAGIVHRDLKPDNIFIVNDDDRQLVKILDFGVAKHASQALDGSNTKTGAMLGTPYYMSPEQAQGIKSVDSRSDLWSLAVIVYQCVTGRLPFESEALGDLLVKIIVQPIPTPSHVAQVPPGFDQWWAKAAERNPDNRFASAKEFASSLAVALGASGMTDPGLRTGQHQLAGTALMTNNALPSALQQSAPQHPYATPHPTNPTPPGMVMGGPMAHASSQNLAQPPATFSGVEPPAAIPKKGPPVAILAGLAGFLVLGVIGAGLLLNHRSSAVGSTSPPGSVSVAAPTPPPPPPPPTAGDPTASAMPSTTVAVAEPSATPSATVAGIAPHVKPPVSPGRLPPTSPPTTKATASAGSPPAASAAASAKKWTPGF
jgi:serine/threonine protein kinase